MIYLPLLLNIISTKILRVDDVNPVLMKDMVPKQQRLKDWPFSLDIFIQDVPSENNIELRRFFIMIVDYVETYLKGNIKRPHNSQGRPQKECITVQITEYIRKIN